jgi:glycerol uptake facilitator-like aquaporin
VVGRQALREGLGELLGSGLLVAVIFVSGAVRVQLGTGTMASALLGSSALGCGYGLVLWSFGSLSGAQTNPLVSVVAALLGKQSWARTFLRLLAQALGAATMGVCVAKLAPYTFVRDGQYAGAHPLAEAVVAFGFMVVALGIAHRRDVHVPLALGAFAMASFWMTDRATVGNPLLSLAVLMVAAPEQNNVTNLLKIASATVLGVGLAVAVALYLFPRAKEAAGVLLFVPLRSRVAGLVKPEQFNH